MLNNNRFTTDIETKGVIINSLVGGREMCRGGGGQKSYRPQKEGSNKIQTSKKGVTDYSINVANMGIRYKDRLIYRIYEIKLIVTVCCFCCCWRMTPFDRLTNLLPHDVVVDCWIWPADVSVDRVPCWPGQTPYRMTAIKWAMSIFITRV